MNTYDKADIQKAVALKYNGQQQPNAPTVVAKGDGQIAQDIIALARLHNVLIHEDEHLAESLSHLEFGQEIPEQLFYVIAELIAFSYVLKGDFPEQWQNIHQKIDFMS